MGGPRWPGAMAARAPLIMTGEFCRVSEVKRPASRLSIELSLRVSGV